jgi:hypothetical protein
MDIMTGIGNRNNSNNKKRTAQAAFGNRLPAGRPLPPQPQTLPTKKQGLRNTLPIQPNETAPENHAGFDALIDKLVFLEEIDKLLTKQSQTPK